MIQIIPQYNGGERLGQSLNNNLDQFLDTYKQLQIEDILSNRKEKRAQKERSRLEEVFKGLNLNPALAGAPESFGLAALKQQSMLGGMQDPAQVAQALQQVGFNPQEATGIAALSPKLQQEVVKRKLMEGGNQAFGNIIGKVASGQPISPNDFQGLNSKDALEATKLLLHQKESAAKEARSAGRHAESQELKRETNDLKKQIAIQSNNAPFLTSISKAADNAEEIRDIAQDMLELWNTGLVDSGVTGKYTPKLLQSEQTQEFVQKADALALKLAAQSGVATNQKIKVAQGIKPNLEVKRETQKAGLDSILSQANKIIKKKDTAYSLIKDGIQPANIAAEVDKILNKPVDLPPADEYLDGTIIEIDGKRFSKSGNKWKAA